jgi:hypothetical protein
MHLPQNVNTLCKCFFSDKQLQNSLFLLYMMDLDKIGMDVMPPGFTLVS